METLKTAYLINCRKKICFSISYWFADSEAHTKRAILSTCPASIEGASPAANDRLKQIRELVKSALEGRDKEVPRRIVAAVVVIACGGIAMASCCFGGTLPLGIAILLLGLSVSSGVLSFFSEQSRRQFPFPLSYSGREDSSVSQSLGLFPGNDPDFTPAMRQKNLEVVAHLAKLTGQLTLYEFQIHPDEADIHLTEEKAKELVFVPIHLSEAKALIDQCDGAKLTIFASTPRHVTISSIQQTIDSYLEEKGFRSTVCLGFTSYWQRV